MGSTAMAHASPLRDAEDLRPLAALMNALSTPRRLAVVRRLLEGPALPRELNKAAGADSCTHDVDLLVRAGIAERAWTQRGAGEVHLIEGALERVAQLLTP